MIIDEFRDGVRGYTSNFGTVLHTSKVDIQFRNHFKRFDYDLFLRAVDEISLQFKGKSFPGMMLLRERCKVLQMKREIVRVPCDVCKHKGYVILIDDDPKPYAYDALELVKTMKHTTQARCKCPNGENWKGLLLWDEVEEATE